MKRTDNLFPKLLGDYLGTYLPVHRNFSKNTIASYCDTFRLLLQYLKSECGLLSNRVTFNVVNRDGILGFLNWLETTRNCSSATINQRLCAIHSFFKYVQGEAPQLMKESQQVLNIPVRKTHTPLVSYLCKEDLEIILQQPNISTKNGRRDLTILCVLYDTGGRVQEIADLTVSSVRLQPPAQITLIGKGGKARTVPLMPQTVKLLENYLRENNLSNPQASAYPLFFNQRKEALSRSGISYILRKYASTSKRIQPTIPDNVTPHMLRHASLHRPVAAHQVAAYRYEPRRHRRVHRAAEQYQRRKDEVPLGDCAHYEQISLVRRR